MKQIEIEAIYTAKVTEYIQNGYTINPTTMSGHQGEIAKIDFRKGDEIIRVMLESTTGWEGEQHCEFVRLVVGRNTEQLRRCRPFDTMCTTIWNNRLEVIEERRFYQIDSRADFFTEDFSEYRAMAKKQLDRYRNKREYQDNKVELPEAARKVAKTMIKRKTGKSRVGSKEIRVFKTTDRKGAAQYYAEYHGRNYRFA